MCTENVHTVVYPDGAEEVTRRVDRCEKRSRGFQCSTPIVFNHPKTYYDARLPPTPRLTPHSSPRPTTPLAYHSASDRESSDHSRRSAGSGSSRRARVTHYTTDGTQFININRRSGSGREERIVIVDGPPTPRTPPQTFTMPFTAPSSPRSGFHMASQHYSRADRPHDSLRPIIVDERPERHVRFGESSSSFPSSQRHRRTHSNESRAENPFMAAGSSEDEQRRRRPSSRRYETQGNVATILEEQHARQRRAERELRRSSQREAEAAAASASAAAAASIGQTAADKRLERDLAKAERIAHLNARIDARPAVPIPHLKRNATDFVQEGRDEADRELREAVREMSLGGGGGGHGLRRHGTGMASYMTAEQQVQAEEEEAQRRRLEERMMPRRRATVGPGSRRHRVLYDDGYYRWE